MRLIDVHVEHYKCIKDSTKFRIDPKITCLVGKNESGKTALLQAIEKIKPMREVPDRFNLLDYPSSEMLEYKSRAQTHPNDVITTTWELNDDDVKSIEELVGTDVLGSRTVKVTKGYYDGAAVDVVVNKEKAFENLIANSALYDEEKKALAELQNLPTVHGHLSSKKPAKAEPWASPREQEVFDSIEEKFPSNDFGEAVEDLVLERLPHVVYFTELMRMPGQVSLDDLKKRISTKNLQESHRIFLSLLGMIGRTPEELEEIGKFEELQRELEATSHRLSQEIFKYWRQNKHLRVQFRFEVAMPNDTAPFNTGYVMRTRIENTRHGVSTSFDERSTGFAWFFSFLAWFGQVRKNYGDNIVILLDEPGLGLHATAQGDLLRYIADRLAQKYQVIYTTHSPFMIDPENLLQVRTVEDIFIPAVNPSDDDQDLGTKVGDQVLSSDRETLFPLQACLGYEITQTLFVGKDCLLVEGPSEILYLPWFSRKLQSQNRTGLDKRWTLTPCGGIDKIPAFLSLFAGQKLHIATLMDFAQGQLKKVRSLRENNILRTGHVLTCEMYAGQAEADIEDVIGREGYIHLVNGAYSLSGPTALSAVKLANSPVRVTQEVEEHMRTKVVSGPEYDHYRPAEFLTQQGIGYTFPGINTALDRFEMLFKDLNALLT